MEKEAFGSRLRETRTQKDYTLQSLAQKAGTGTVYLGAAERGLKMPSLDSVIRIAEAYLSNQFDMINVTLCLNFVKQYAHIYLWIKLKRYLDNRIYSVTAQERGIWLFDHRGEFAMRPDLVIRRENDIFVMDTKWKLLNPAKPNGGISQNDMYQMCEYQHKFHAKHVTLLYPKPESGADLAK